MLTGTFVLLAVTAMLVHYLLVDRPAEARAEAARPQPIPIAPADAVDGVPEQVFLQSTFTWTRPRENGEIFVGLHPMLTSLVGIDYSLHLVADDTEVELGTPFLRIRRGDRELQVLAPVDGVVVEGNTDFTPLPGWRGSTVRGGSWVYRIRPRRLERETPRWLQGETASRWAHQKYREVRDFLLQTEVHQEVGSAAADGGELPSGVLGLLDAKAWSGFQETFLHPPNGNGGE